MHLRLPKRSTEDMNMHSMVKASGAKYVNNYIQRHED